MPFVACPGCGNKTYSIRVHIVLADCLVCGVRLLSPSTAVPAGLRASRHKRQLNDREPRR